MGCVCVCMYVCVCVCVCVFANLPICLLSRAGAWQSRSSPPMPPPACGLEAEESSWSCTWTPRRPLPPIFLSPSLSLSVSPARAPKLASRPSPSAAARCYPELRRRALKLRLAARILLVGGIELETLESPSPSPFSP
jgi:hypothetical protein